MRTLLLAAVFCLAGLGLRAQNFEVAALEDSYKGAVGEIIQAPIRIKNTSDKPVTIIVRRIETQIGSTQRNFFCPEKNCFDQRSDSYSIRIEPGQTVENFSLGLEAGLTEGFSLVKYQVSNKANPNEAVQLEVNYSVETKREKSSIYSSPFITLHDVYPNPVITSARIDYQVHQERAKIKIIVHNLLGSRLSSYELLPTASSIKIDADALNTGIYFYTLYVNNESVMTRKLMVKK